MTTTALTILSDLNTSWKENTDLEKLAIVSQGDSFRFAPQGRFTLASKDNFLSELRRIKTLFSQAVAPSNPDRELLELLEKRINVLGTAQFKKRECCFLLDIFYKRSFSDFQIRHFPPTKLAKVDSIKHGLPNANLILCWLNASMIYLASTNMYDPILSTPQEPKLEGLRVAILHLVNALRTNEDQAIINCLHAEVITQIKTNDFHDFLKRQADADEFLRFLQSRFICDKAPDDLVQSVTIYKQRQDEHVTKRGRQNELTSRIMISPSEVGDIDIQECFSKLEIKEGITNYLRYEKERYISVTDKNHPVDFQCQDVCIQLPQKLEVCIKRGNVHLQGQESGLMSSQKIKIGPGGTITLTEYQPEYAELDGETVLYAAHPIRDKVYQIVTSIERIGVFVHNGHYVAHVRSPDDTITYHSDTKVQRDKPETVWEQAYIMQLKCIKTIER